ncbi:hypothetical protein LTR48_009053, partial [Friedmanniomyces endolithicus]
ASRRRRRRRRQHRWRRRHIQHPIPHTRIHKRLHPHRPDHPHSCRSFRTEIRQHRTSNRRIPSTPAFRRTRPRRSRGGRSGDRQRMQPRRGIRRGRGHGSVGGEAAECAEGSREPGAGIAAFALVLAGCYVQAGDGGEVCAGVRGVVVGIAGGV